MRAASTVGVPPHRRFLAMRQRVLACVWLVSFWACAAHADGVSPRPAHVQRLADAARLWSRVQWVHPALAEGRIDWDRALLDAMPALAAAESEEAERAALLKLLQPLHDPAVRVGRKLVPRYVQAGEQLPLIEWLPGRVALLNLHRPIATWDAAFDAGIKEAGDAIQAAKAVVADLRPAGESFAGPDDLLNRLLPRMVTKPVQMPSQRARFHYGYPPQSGSTYGGYYTAWLVQSSRSITPDSKPRAVPMAFIVNEWTAIPLSVLALHKAGLAYIIAEGPPNLSWVVPTEEVRVGADLRVRFATGQLVFPDGSSGFGADQVLAYDPGTGPGGHAVQAALRLLASSVRPGRGVAWKALPPLPLWTADRRYAEPGFPDLPLRQLAVIRLWSVIDAFFPYKDLLDQPWEGVLPEFLGRVERVKDDRDYALAVAEMAARLQDNHVRVSGGQSGNVLGEAALPVRLGMVEGKVVITQVLDAAAAGGLALWDEVLEVDGEPTERAIGRLSVYLASANAWTRDRNALRRALGRGADGSPAVLRVRDAAAAVREVTLLRSSRHATVRPVRREGDQVRVLPGNIGYADLDRLTVDKVDELFDRVKDTRALILDMRGYPKLTAWAIAPRLNVKRARLGAVFTPNLIVGGTGETEPMRAAFVQTLPEGDGKPVYTGNVLMLINEQTQSQAEHTGLMFEAACDITFVGSASAGSNGDVTNLVLPGNLVVSFTGQGVRHPDGRQLQRVGLQPDLPVAPTLEGLRAGKDEVLDRAVRYVESGR